jgi:MFS family permease
MSSPGWIRAQIGTLIIATSLVQLANGYFTTFLSLRLSKAEFGASLTGLVLSSYFAGFTLGALRSGRIIERIGYIRAYAAFAGLVVVATAAMPMRISPGAWIILRALIGFGCSGIFVTTESWLNAKAEPSKRGSVFSIYMVGTFLALALGQLLIVHIPVEGSQPFHTIEALFAVALVTVTLTKAEPPLVTPTGKLPFSQLWSAAPLAVAGCITKGLVSSTFYALVPAWAQNKNVERETIALFMLVAVLGGLAFQIPVGRISDRFDRRIVLASLATGLAATALAIVYLPDFLLDLLPAAALLGGFISTLYPVSAANAHDRMPADRVVAVSGQLILMSGVGSVMGPLIGTNIMTRFEINGVFYFIAAAAGLLALLAVTYSKLRTAPFNLRRPFKILPPDATLITHDPVGSSANAPAAPDGNGTLAQ